MLIEQIDKLSYPQAPRGYIGASTLGHVCDRYIWFQKEHKEIYTSKEEIDKLIKKALNKLISMEINRRTHTIFELGKWVEKHALELIEQLPEWCLVETQTEVATEYIKGHTDGLLKHLPTNEFYLLEIKSMKDSSFKKSVKNGIQESHPQYYDQCQTYLYLTKETNKLILMAINKDNGDLYEELIDLDENHAYNLLKKAERIWFLKKMPIGLYVENKPRFECNFCNFKNICHGK